MSGRSIQPTRGYTAFGIPLASTLAFPGAWRDETPGPDPTIITLGELPDWSGRAEGGWRGVSDGEALDVIQSRTGQYRFCHRSQAVFHLCAGHRRLIGDPAAFGETWWWRLLLDSVLFTVSLLRGNEALHAGAVGTGSGAVAIVAGTGGGKSTLLDQLVRDGYPLVSDDILFLQARVDDIAAYPGPPLMLLARDRADGAGPPVGELGDEILLAVPVAPEPQPLRRLVLLDRRPGAATGMHRIEPTLATLIRQMLGFPATPDRELARFDLASALATRTEMWQLVADDQVRPEELAALAVRGLSA